MNSLLFTPRCPYVVCTSFSQLRWYIYTKAKLWYSRDLGICRLYPFVLLFFFNFEAVWKGCRGRTTLPYLSLTWLYDLVIMSSESAHFWRKPQELMCSIWHLLLSYIQLKWLISCVLVLTFSFCLFCFYFFYNWFLWFWICSLYLCLLLSMLLLTYQCSSALI